MDNCYWYYEEPYMGGHIAFCKLKIKADDIQPIEKSDCRNCPQYHDRNKPTKADRIRSKNDEELAEFLKEIALNGGVETGGKIMTWLDWLRSEAE